MKACVVGLGAVGGMIAARIAASGQRVAALARGATLQAVRAAGLTLVEGERRTTVAIDAHERPESIGAQDVVIVSVKTTSIASVAGTIGPLIGPETVVVSAMNGIPWWFFSGLAPRWRGTRLEACDPAGEIARAIREGVSRDGRPLFPMMNYKQYRHLTDEDVLAIVAYLRSVPAIDNPVPRTQIDFPVSMFARTAPEPLLDSPPPWLVSPSRALSSSPVRSLRRMMLTTPATASEP